MPTSACPFVWYELMTKDAAAGMSGMSYTLLSVGETQIGGLMALTDDMCAAGARPGWLGYVGVADMDSQAERIVKAGGDIHMPPTDIPGVSRFAAAADPQGASLCIFKGNLDAPPPQPPAGTPRTFGWHELHAGNGAAALSLAA